MTSFQSRLWYDGKRMLEIEKFDTKNVKIGRGDIGRVQIAYYTLLK